MGAKMGQNKKSWVMLIEEDKCVGCFGCMVACKAENEVPDGIFRNWVVEYSKGKFPDLFVKFQPQQCNHCDNAPCIRACPTGASFKREDGIVRIDERRCIGCKLCIAACPYDARYLHEEKGVVNKCTFCVQRLDYGIKHNNLENFLPACVETCVAGVRTFGDLNDKNSLVYKKLNSNDYFVLKEDQGTKPRVFYIRKK